MKYANRRFILVLVLVCVMVFVSGCTLFDSGKYKSAQQLFDEGKYTEAQNTFEQIQEYEESGKYIAYISALFMEESGQYADATEAFNALVGFLDSENMALYCGARYAEMEERYEDAAVAYQQILTFRDSETRNKALPELILARDEKRRANKYIQAQNALSISDYENAIVAFEALGNYEQASMYLMYARAAKMAEDGNYELAVNSFNALENFHDSKLQVKYYTARWAEAEQRYEEAETIYKTIGTFRDSFERLARIPDLILDRNFALARAVAMGEKNEWEIDINIYELVSCVYSDSETRMLEQFDQLGDDTLEAGLYDAAYTIFSWLAEKEYVDAKTRMQDTRFAWAKNQMMLQEYPNALDQLEQLFAEGYTAAKFPMYECYYELGKQAEEALDYAGAYAYYEKANGYEDSAARAAKYVDDYAAAEKLLAEGKYSEAATAFANLGNYSDASTRVNESHYKHGEALQTESKWSEAIIAFASAGAYSDAANRILETYYKQGEALQAQSSWDDAITAFSCSEEYSDGESRIAYCLLRKEENSLVGSTDQDALFTMAAKYLKQGTYLDCAERVITLVEQANGIVAARYAEITALTTEGKCAEAEAVLKSFGQYGSEQHPAYYYAIAEKYVDLKQWDEAIAAFTKAGTYENAVDRITETKNAKADSMKAEADWEAALLIYQDLEDEAGIKSCQYQIALGLVETAPRKAYDAFVALADYEDSAAWVDKLYSSTIVSVSEENPAGVCYFYSDSSGQLSAGLIDRNGVILLTAEYDHIFQIDGYEDVFVLQSGKRYGLANSAGKVILDVKYKQIQEGSNDKQYLMIKDDDGYGFVRASTGEIIVEPQWKAANQMYDGYAYVQNKLDKWGIIDINGKVIVEPTYDQVVYHTDCGCAVINQKMVYSNKGGLLWNANETVYYEGNGVYHNKNRSVLFYVDGAKKYSGEVNNRSITDMYKVGENLFSARYYTTEHGYIYGIIDFEKSAVLSQYAWEGPITHIPGRAQANGLYGWIGADGRDVVAPEWVGMSPNLYSGFIIAGKYNTLGDVVYSAIDGVSGKIIGEGFETNQEARDHIDQYLVDMTEYFEQGEKELAAGNWDKAIAAFELAGDHSDAKKRITYCNIRKAEEALLESDDIAAIVAVVSRYKSMGAYLDCAERANNLSDRGIPVGSYVTFGAYEQDNNTSNGKEDIEWLVLAQENNRLLVISRYALDTKPYNKEHTYVTWETCTLRKWLNNDFLNAVFSSTEKAMIPTVTVSADKNPDYRTNPGNATQDKVFLLSIPEVNKYFTSDSARQCKSTAYAEKEGASRDGYCWWWLRSPGYNPECATGVNYDGGVRGIGSHVDYDNGVVRPALWISLEP